MPPDDLPEDLQRPLDEVLAPRLRPAAPPHPATSAEPAAPREPASTPEPAEPTSTPEPDTTAEPTASEPDTAAEPTASEPDTAAEPAGTVEPASPTGPTPGPEAAPAPDAAPPPVPASVASHARRRLTASLGRVALAPARTSRRAGRAVAAWSHRPAGRFALPGFAMALLLLVAGTAGLVLVPAVDAAGDRDLAADPTAAPPGVAATPSVPGLPPPPEVTTTPGFDAGLPGARADALQGWAGALTARTGVPAVALQAYGYAELVVARTHPSCQLSWTTLAAIGRVESNHGRTGGAALLPDGRTDPPIIGLPLDGQGGRELIADTDGGAMDGDTVYDRAVGPMQFIPQTWNLEAVDATGDGIADVHNINDAALASANYLCRHGRDLTTPTGWWGAVLAYNNVQAYADAVFAAANEYGQLSRA